MAFYHDIINKIVGRTEFGLNSKNEIVTKTILYAGFFVPKSGYLIVGDKGVEFRGQNGIEFIKIPWKDIKVIKPVLTTRGKKTKGLEVATIKDEKKLIFRPSHGNDVLYIISKHLKLNKEGSFEPSN